MEDKLLPITQAAEFLGVSIDTLRRWDKSGELIAVHKNGGTHRYYNQRDLELFSSDLFKMAADWAAAGGELPNELYCANSAVFQTRLMRMQEDIMRSGKQEGNALVPLIGAVAGEIGNNSFDHNLGNWPDMPGIFFGYNIGQRIIVLADRGLGILGTLKRVRPSLTNHQEALRVAFTEVVSGRAPEERGNGLKFVRKVISEYPMTLLFQSGDAQLRIGNQDPTLQIAPATTTIQGCLVKLTYDY